MGGRPCAREAASAAKGRCHLWKRQKKRDRWSKCIKPKGQRVIVCKMEEAESSLGGCRLGCKELCSEESYGAAHGSHSRE